MKSIIICLLPLILANIAIAQRGDIVIPPNSTIDVPLNAQLCADDIYANHVGFGTLTLADSSGICSGASIVRVELSSFSGAYNDGTVALFWRTENESNCARFQVQRSTDGATWYAIGDVPAAGTSASTQTYRFDDVLSHYLLSLPSMLYRLKIIDFDATFEYAPILDIAFSDMPVKPELYSVFPNPSSGSITVRYFLPETGIVDIVLYGIAGRKAVVILNHEQQPKGIYSVLIPMSELQKGIYFVEFTVGEVRRIQRIVLTM
jgi:hypothetical protein